MTEIFNIDACILLWIQESVRCGFLDPIMKFITHLGDEGYLWIAVTLILLIFKKTRKVGVACAISMILGLIITNIWLKNWVARIRPYEVIEGLTTIVGKQSDFSFPSGHSTNSLAAAAVIFAMVPRKYGWPTLILAILIALSRLYVGVHYPTDVIAGIAIGCATAWCARYAVNTFWPEKK